MSGRKAAYSVQRNNRGAGYWDVLDPEGNLLRNYVSLHPACELRDFCNGALALGIALERQRARRAAKRKPAKKAVRR